MKMKLLSTAISIVAAMSMLLPISASASTCTCESDVGVRVRSGPGIMYDQIGLINNGENIDVIETYKNWGKIIYNGYEGWTCLDYYSEELDVHPDLSYSNRDNIINYLTTDLDLNEASAEAIATNMDYESECTPTASCIDTNGLPSFGLCQWNGERFDNLKYFCNNNGLDYTTTEAQLKFLKYELEHGYASQYNKMKTFDNTADGCYNAAYYWASRFEVCSSSYWETRANSAYQNYLNR